MKTVLFAMILISSSLALADKATLICEDNLVQEKGTKYSVPSDDPYLPTTRLAKTLEKLNVKGTPSLAFHQDPKTNVVLACAIATQ